MHAVPLSRARPLTPTLSPQAGRGVFRSARDCPVGKGKTAHGRASRHPTATRPSPRLCGTRHRRRRAGHHPGADPSSGAPAAAKSAQERIARRPNRECGVLFLGRAGVVPEALRRHPDRRVPALRQPAQELHPGQRDIGGAVMVGPDRHPPRISQAAVRRDRDQHVYDGHEHSGRRLHGRNGAGQFGLGPSHCAAPVRPASLLDRQRPRGRISGEHRLRLDRRGVRRRHVLVGAGERCCFCGNSGNDRIRDSFWRTPGASSSKSPPPGRCGEPRV